MNADKFGAEYAPASGVEDEAEFLSLVDTIAILREALQEAWRVFDALGAHAPDDDRLAIMRSSQFSSAAYRVRTAMLKTRRGL